MSFYYITDEQAGGDGAVVIAVGGEVDYAASPRLRESIREQIDAGHRHLVLDLSEATFIDSTAIGVLAGAAGRLREAGDGSLSLVCGQENRPVLRIFDITGIASLIGVHGSRDEALSAVAA